MFKIFAPYVAEPYEPTHYYKYFLFREDAEKHLERLKRNDYYDNPEYYTFGVAEIMVEDGRKLQDFLENFKDTLSS